MTNWQFTCVRLLTLALMAVLLFTVFVHHPMDDPAPEQTTTTTSTLK